MSKLLTQQKHSGSFFPLLWQPIRGLKPGAGGERMAQPASWYHPLSVSLATTRQEQHAFSHFRSILPASHSFSMLETLCLFLSCTSSCAQSDKLQSII
ncbi:uncharacterized [Tachysurus ichikawai]